MLIRTSLLVTVMSALAFSVASAQEARRGRADLRYTSPMPAKLSYVSVDSMQMVNSGTPIGDMTINANMRSIVDLDISAADVGVRMKAQLKEFTGSVETPMGNMPVPTQATNTSTEFNVGIKGMDLKKSFEDAKKAGLPSGGDMQSLLGRTRESAPLLVLPGKELNLRETWTDTLTANETIEGLVINVQMVVRGTYERDTVVAGRTLNILAIQTVTSMKSNGILQGMQMDQTVNTTASDHVLWDSDHHALVSTLTTAEMKMQVVMAGMGNMSMSGTIKSSKHRMD